MQRGDQAKIARFTGLSQATVQTYYSGKKVKFRNHLKIQNAIRRLNIKVDNFTPPEYTKKPIDRYDIYSNLPYGAEKKIASSLKSNRHKVWNILHGKTLDDCGVIKEAELEAAINIWKTRFCKYDSLL
jgi:transcriptional regulator with XRE-family HTH domain